MYKIPGRNSQSIKRRFIKLVQADIAKLKNKSCHEILLSALNTTITKEGCPVTKQQWLQDLIEYTKDLSEIQIRFIFPRISNGLISDGRVNQLDDGTVEIGSPTPRPVLPP